MITIFCASADISYSQVSSISLDLKNVTLEEALDEIRQKGEYSLWYRNEEINLNKKVSIQAVNKEITQVLDNLLANENLGYIVEDRHIIIYKKEGRLAEVLQQVGRKITGTVTDEYGEPVIGANVIEKGTTNGVVTDFNGQFSLQVSENATIQVSYIGYIEQEISVKEKTDLKIILREDSQSLDEVVVVGYGTQKKVNLTGSVASISTEDVKDRVQSNLLSAVQGTVPGVTIITRPDGKTSINFRGPGNLGKSEPLYIIDGAIVSDSFFNNLDPNSIESVSFLKDAASSAIYGSRAAYGVVLVTTKKGKPNKMTVNYNGYVGISSPTYIPEVVDSWDYATLLNEGIWNRDTSKDKYQAYSQEQIDLFRSGAQPDLYPNSRWYDLILDKHVVTTRHSVELSGGTEKLRFFTGLGYLYNENPGFMPGRKKDRYNLNFSATSDLNKWLTLRAGAKFIKNTYKSDNAAPTLTRMSSLPGIMVGKQSNGEWGSMAGGQQAQQTFLQGNPLRVLAKQDWSEENTDNSMYDLAIDIKPIDRLVISGQAIYTGTEYKKKSYSALQDEVNSFTTGAPIPGTGTYTNKMDMSWTSTTRMLYTATAKYNWTMDIHHIDVLAGTSFENTKYQALNASRKNFPIDGLKDIEAGSNAGTDISNGGGSYQDKMLSYFGRINYVLNDRYLFEANIRADASSRFHPDNRWGVFPSFSAGWRINQENFMKDVSWIHNLKLRASWGQLGNINNVGHYDYFQNYSASSNYTFDDQDVKGISESRPANEGLGWETVTLTDIGIDFDIFDGKISFGADYYIKKTKDILLDYNVPAETGISNLPSQNIGKVENKGFEFVVTHQNKIGDFSYSVSANMAFNDNKITDLGGSNNMIYNGGDKIRYIRRVGEPIGSFFGYQSNGRLYTQQEIDAGEYYNFGRVPNAGDIRYQVFRDNVAWKDNISGEDRVVLGKDVPDLTYGINLSMRYQNVEFSAFGQGAHGAKVAIEVDQITPFASGNNPKKMHLKRWTVENPNPYAASPRLYGGHSFDNYNEYFSDFNLFNADYFRIKSLTLGYNLPAGLINRLNISALKIFATGENLFTIRGDKRMKDFDPEEMTGRGLGGLGTKTIAFGVNLSF